MSPLRDSTGSNNIVIDTLSTLSLEQISEMETTLHHVKMIKLRQLHLPQAVSQDGIPWLAFQYITRSTSTRVTIRVDIDTISEFNSNTQSEIITSEFRSANCLYPSADGPEQSYKGTRRGYERECNEQGWKLAYLNPTILNGKKGLLQQAVVSLRNATAEQKSRRAKRKEKKVQEDVTRTQLAQFRNPVMALPRLNTTLNSFQPQHQQDQGHFGQNSVEAQSSQASRILSWQPTLVSSLHRSIQHPTAQNTIPRYNPSGAVPPRISDDDYHSDSQLRASSGGRFSLTHLPAIADANPAYASPSSKPTLPISSTSFEDAGEFIEFDRYFQGQFQKSRIRCDIMHVKVEEIPFDFKKSNCVYPRSFLALEAEQLDEPSSSSGHHQQWKSVGARQAEEAYLNEIGWKLCFINRTLLDGKRLLLQQALDAYRRRFLPATCHPRARVEPLLLTRRSSASCDMPLGPPDHSHLHNREEQSQRRVRVYSEKASDEVLPKMKQRGRVENMSEKEIQIESAIGQEEEDDEEDEDEEDEEDDDEIDTANDLSSEDETSDSSSSEGDFHSQMSLLTFQGNIRTYNLGTRSGSARSRPRIKPTTASRVMTLRSPRSSPFSLASATTVRKRPSSGYTYQGRQQVQPQEELKSPKRIRFHNPLEDIDSHKKRDLHEENTQEEQDQTDLDSVSSYSGVESKDDDEGLNQDDEETDWWTSRLQNSEYPEDQNFVNMTPEELIGLLTGGYNGDLEGEDEDESDIPY
ncbi:hypothetical protein BGX27_001915 [Mortierella sp. AM989]|nr:hypothetical protein BGX27_001915 [Mortierella sp. AM989]